MNVTPSGVFTAAADNGADPSQFSHADRMADANLVAAQPDSIGSSLDLPKTDALAQIAMVPVGMWQNAGQGTSATTSAASAPDSVANMSLSDKVLTTANSGIASAAKDAGGAVGTFLKDPKNAAMLAAGTGTLVAAQAVPGLDVGVDATLGVVGAAMYASAGPEHRENISKALGNLKDYVSEVGSAKTQADLDKASNDFAGFLKTGGKEAADAIGVVAGAAGAPSKLLGLAAKAKALGGVDGIIAAASKGVRNAGAALSRGAGAIQNGLENAGKWLDAAGAKAGLGHNPAFAVSGGNAAAVRTAGVGAKPLFAATASDATKHNTLATPATASKTSVETEAKTVSKPANRSADLPSALKTSSTRVRNELVKNGDAVDKAVTQKLPSNEWSGHHLIPVSTIRKNQDLFAKASEVPGGFRTDESTNLTALPNSAAAQKTLKANGIDRPIHNSGHANTIDDVNAKLRQITLTLRREGLTPKSPGYGQRANELIHGMQQNLRHGLQSSDRLTDNISPASGQSALIA